MSEKTWKRVLLPRGVDEIIFLNTFPLLAEGAKFQKYGDTNYHRIHALVHTCLSVEQLEDVLKMQQIKGVVKCQKRKFG
jgi:hypothetical protein